MTAPAFDAKKTFPNQDNFNRTLPSEEELKLQIEKLKREVQGDRLTLKRLIVGSAYLTPFFVIILFATWFFGWP